MEKPLPELMTTKELKEYLHCSSPIVYNLVRKRTFPSLKIGGQWFINKEKLLVWIENQCKK